MPSSPEVAAAVETLLRNGWHEVEDGLVLPDQEYRAVYEKPVVTVVSTPHRQFGTAPFVKHERDQELTDRKLDYHNRRRLDDGSSFGTPGQDMDESDEATEARFQAEQARQEAEMRGEMAEQALLDVAPAEWGVR